MNEDMKNLIKLQSIDCEIDEIEKSKDQFPQDIDEISNLLADKKAQVEHHKNKIEECEKEKRRLENEIKTEEERIKKDKEKLSQVKTNEEYHALLREIDNSRREISDRETAVLKLLESSEDAQKAVEDQNSGLKNLEEEISQKREELKKFLDGVDQNIAAKVRLKEECQSTIKASLLNKYNMIKRKKGYGEVLARVINYSCSGCDMHIPPQMFNEIISEKTVHICPSCERILYWSNDDEKND